MLKNLNSETMKKILYFLLLFATVVALGISLYTLHDLQTAEGAGLYLSIVFGHSQRTFFDILVDLMGMLLFLALLLLPCLFLKHLQLPSFFRFLAVYLAFLPTIHPGNVVHLGNTLFNLSLRESVLQGNFLRIIFVECASAFDILKYMLPLLLLLLYLNKSMKLPVYAGWKLLLFSVACLLVLHVLFDGLADTTLFLVYYLLSVWCFAEWETTCKTLPRFANWSMIFFVGCLLRGIYRMLALLGNTHI